MNVFNRILQVLFSVSVMLAVHTCVRSSVFSEMWMNHYKDLYNSVDNSQSKNLVCQHIELMTQKLNVLPCFSVLDVFDACRRQKCGKAVGSDGISMEVFIYGGTRLYVHISMLFNL